MYQEKRKVTILNNAQMRKFVFYLKALEMQKAASVSFHKQRMEMPSMRDAKPALEKSIKRDEQIIKALGFLLDYYDRGYVEYI